MLPPMAQDVAKELHKERLREAQMHRLVKEARADNLSLLQRARQVLQRKAKGRSQRAAPQQEPKLSVEK